MKKAGKTFMKDRLTLLISVLLPTYMFFFHAPLEIFFTNRESFWFGLKDLGGYAALVFMGVFLILFLLGAFLPAKIRNIYSVLAVAGGICIYAQGNFLNLDLGLLNGGEIVWSDYSGAFITNGIIWLAIVVVGLVLYIIFREKSMKVFAGVAAFVVLVQVMTLGILFISGYVSEAEESNNTVEYTLTDRNLYTVSEDENVIIFILDMFDNQYMRDILADTPDVQEAFRDFTFFDNAVGSYSTTCYAVGSILTGQYVQNDGASIHECINNAYEQTQLYDDLAQMGYKFDIYAVPGMIPDRVLEMAGNYEAGTTYVSDNWKLLKRIYRLAVCRYAPNFLKQYFWMDGTEFAEFKALKNAESKSFSDDNTVFYSDLKKKGLTVSADKRFKVIHLWGVHYPYKIDADANPIRATSDAAQALDTAKGNLKMIETYLEEMKNNGTYQNSTIILVADHGFYKAGVLTNPLVMVKRANVNTDFTVSYAPVSHLDLHATIMSALNENADGQYGKSMFDIQPGEERERLFYQYDLDEPKDNWKFRLIEWKVDGHGNERKYFSLTGNEYDLSGNVSNHFENCAYCSQYGTEPVDAPNDECHVHSRKQ